MRLQGSAFGSAPFSFKGLAMRAWIEDVDAENVAFVHATAGEDLQALKDHCQALRSAGLVGTKDDRLAMRVDGTVIMDWCNKKGIAWHAFWQDRAIQTRFLDDPDNAAFRVWEGRV